MKNAKNYFLESYDKNTKKAGEKAALDMIEASLTMGGVLALGYALFKGRKPKDIAQNLAITDKVALGGTFDRWRKNPLEAIKDISSIYIEKAVNKVKDIVYPIIETGKKVANRIKDTATSIIKAGKEQFNTFIEFISPKKKVAASKPAKKSQPKASKTFRTIVNKMTKPITSVLQNRTVNSTVAPKSKVSAKLKTSSKPKATTKPKASSKPKTTAKPKATPKPKTTAKPKASSKTKTTTKPKASPKPKTSVKPKATPKPKSKGKRR